MDTLTYTQVPKGETIVHRTFRLTKADVDKPETIRTSLHFKHGIKMSINATLMFLIKSFDTGGKSLTDRANDEVKAQEELRFIADRVNGYLAPAN